MRMIHLETAEGRDTRVAFGALRPEAPPSLGRPPHEDGTRPKITFRRYVAHTEAGSIERLQRKYGEDLGQALVDGDPEVDVERVGQRIGQTSVIWLTADGDVLHAPPAIVEVVYGPDGEEKGRREPVEQAANIDDVMPVRITKRRMKRSDAVRRFVFTRSQHIQHVDGLTFDHLHKLAKELDEADEMVLVGGGPKGRDPLIFQSNGTPWRAFLEGRVDGERFRLLLHLSNMELKRP